MATQMTEMLKGTLEGIVLAILAERSAYGYEITASLRERGFDDIAEGTIYALLVRIEQKGLVSVEKVPSEKGPPRKVYSLGEAGRARLAEFWESWDFLAAHIDGLRAPANPGTQPTPAPGANSAPGTNPDFRTNGVHA
ncbi:PadR family transcriptional regulator [Leucobacter sp. L43]|uniref:PadR family transcriptional regulator n=1 Tax=Leucobacter sp. L43 TaxID=2798040 RepID=UPI000AF9FA75|nr:PadR family transcriptional regulator [Leucobacter sp. L43]